MGLVRNRAQVHRQVQMSMTRVEGATVALYRRVVWEIFTRILEQTPQFTGRAVANWNLGINAPDMSVDYGMGDDVSLTASGYYAHATRERGDRKWIQEAEERARYLMRRIRKGDKVFISNAVLGDDDAGGSAGFPYMAALQEPGYWATKLRNANKPYETAMESAIFVVERFLATGEMPLAGLEDL